jgi:ribosome-binding factor A
MSRAIRVGDFIRDEISNIVKTEVRDPRVTRHLTVNDVVVSKDLSQADIYVSSFEYDSEVNQEGIVEVLNKASGFFRTKLSKRHTMRSTPKLKFHYDTLTKDGMKLERIIIEARSKDQDNNTDHNG